jgi:pimeloyl-ACP methyl ester carboxylesterase
VEGQPRQLDGPGAQRVGFPVEEHTDEVDGIPVFWQRAANAGGVPTLYLHGVPTTSDDWLPFISRCGGIAPDLPGFGRSGKRGDWDYSIGGYDAFLERLVDYLELDRFALVMHDWGAVGLALAQRIPERVERVVLMNVVPLLPGYRWHWVARMWRRRLVGELFMGATTRFALKQLSRASNAAQGPLPADMLDAIWEHFDQGTQRAILGLYRGSPPERLEAAGARLGDVRAPALVLWGDRDPYIPLRFADDYAAALPAGEVRHVPEAGHWPWVDQPALVDDVCAFLSR